jgi:hypothetical protein
LRAHSWGEAGARTSCIRRRDLSQHRARSYPWPCRFSASSNESCLSSILLSRKAYCVRQLLVASSPRHIHNIANTSRYLSWPNLARGNDHSLGNPLACRVEAAAAAPNVHRRHLIRRELRLRLAQPQKKLRILLSPMASIANLECSGECAQGIRPEGLHALQGQ